MRERHLINQNWQFDLGSSLSENKQEVCLPHTVTLTPAISSGGRNYQGLCCYQRKLYLSSEQAANKVFLSFEGAMGKSSLSVNGSLAARHYCGYTPLSADVSSYIHEGENTLFLILDNADDLDMPPGKAQEELDYSYDGGLYRDAWLTFTKKLYITDPLLANRPAGGGIFVWYTNVSKQSANIHVKIHIANELENKQHFAIQANLIDSSHNSHKIVSAVSLSSSCPNADCIDCELLLTLEEPKLWSPEAPNLYQLEIRLIQNDTVLDNISETIGIRTFVFTRHNGLILNDVSRKLLGANYHQTFPYIGNGVPNNLLIRDIKKLLELGMQNIRGHYPFSNAFMNACDSLGMTVILSLPGWQWFKEGTFVEQCYQNIRDIIRWHRNHPSVLLWEPLPNETELPGWFQREILDIVAEEYPYEPCYTASDHAPTKVSYREYDPDMLAPGMENYGGGSVESLKENPLWIREHGDAPDNWTDQNCAWRVPRGFGDAAMLRSVDRMLGLDPQMPTGGYLTMYLRDDICGYGVWPGIEHNRGYHINPCWGGYYDLFRIKKFSGEFIETQQNRELVGERLFIANWWTEFSPKDVTIFSNAERVRLYYNEVLIGETAPEPLSVPHPPFVFKNVRENYKKRDRAMLKAEACVDGKVVATATQMSPGVPIQLALECDTMGIPLQADGSDMLLIHCKLLDAEGNLVPLMGDRHPILFEVEGEAEIVGDDTIGANPVCAEAGIASILVKATKQSGEITIRAKMFWPQRGAMAIRPCSLQINSDAVITSFDKVVERIL